MTARVPLQLKRRQPPILVNKAPVERSILAYFANYHLTSLNRDFTKQRRRRQRERQKTIGLMSRTTTLHVHHAFLYISLPSMHNYDVK